MKTDNFCRSDCCIFFYCSDRKVNVEICEFSGASVTSYMTKAMIIVVSVLYSMILWMIHDAFNMPLQCWLPFNQKCATYNITTLWLLSCDINSAKNIRYHEGVKKKRFITKTFKTIQSRVFQGNSYFKDEMAYPILKDKLDACEFKGL